VLSIIIPTYNEKENIKELAEKIFCIFKQNNIEGEIVVVDDNSPDGTGSVAEKLKDKYAIEVVHRPRRLGLASAVTNGFIAARGDVLCVMDADLSHPPEAIPDMFRLIQEEKADFVVGSRYVKGGSSKEWPFIRRFISSLSCSLTRGLTGVKDATSGYFMIKKEVIKDAVLKPKGFKICLEIIVRGTYKSICEVPIIFTDRKHGKSKLGFSESIKYGVHLIELYSHKFPLMAQFLKFALVGLIGFFIQMIILYNLVEILDLYYLYAAVIAFFVAVTSNFLLNRTWTFTPSSNRNIYQQYISFVSLCVLGALLNTFLLFVLVEYAHLWYLNAQCISFVFVGLSNFLFIRSITFS